MALVWEGTPYAEVAAETGLNHETVRRQLRGGSKPSLEFIVATLVTRGVSADWLFRGSRPK